MLDNLNSILLEGELIENPEVDVDDYGIPVCRFKIASKKFIKGIKSIRNDKVETYFFDIITYDKEAKICSESLLKGSCVRLIGWVKQDLKTEDNKIVFVGTHIELKPKTKGD